MADENKDLNLIAYQAEPTAVEFHASDDFVRGIMGPIGSGKSVMCIIEMIARAQRQEPWNSVRRSRWAVVRNTYPELKTTTIKTFRDWMPEEIAPIKWDSPITAMCRFQIEDGTTVELEVVFLALDLPDDVKKLKSLELTGVLINEASEIDKAIMDMATGRVGRYPPKKWGGPTWTGVIMDTNPPDDDHWWYRMAEEEKPHGWKFWRQPPALLRVKRGDYYDYVPNMGQGEYPAAENICNHSLGFQYYLNQVGGKTQEWIDIFVMGQYGTVHDGKPVYPEWKDQVHVSETEIEPFRGLPLLLGWDFGLTPAVAICQVSPRGQFRVLDELVSTDMGIRQFARDIVKPHLANHYAGMPIESIGDPAGSQRTQTDTTTCMQELKNAGLTTEAARTNEMIARREAVAGFLNRMIDGEPGFLLSPRCRTLRKGFNGGYKFERVKVSGTERHKDKPAKNHFSHVHDALQYAALHVEQGVKRVNVVRPVQQVSAGGWT